MTKKENLLLFLGKFIEKCVTISIKVKNVYIYRNLFSMKVGSS